MPFCRLPLAVLALCLTAGSVSAQDAAQPMNRRPMNLIAMEGPPEQAAFAKAIGLSADQAAKYGHLRAAYLEATKVERDSMEGMRARLRARPGAASQGSASEPRSAARRSGGMQAMRPLVDTLEARFADFEGDLAFLLSAEQQKKYEAWKAAETERMRREMIQRRQ